MTGVTLLDASQAKMNDLGSDALLGDVCANKSNTLSAGFYEQGPGPLKYTYTYDEAKVVLEGELHIKDTTTGETFVATPGKVLNISNGAALEFTAPTKAKVFYVAQRAQLE